MYRDPRGSAWSRSSNFGKLNPKPEPLKHLNPEAVMQGSLGNQEAQDLQGGVALAPLL